MSSDDLTQEILDAYGRLLVENYCIIASSAVLFADTVFTFTDEVQRIWNRRFTGATLIFLLTRYAAVAERIVLVTSVVIPTVQDKTLIVNRASCVRVLRLDDTLTDISYLTFGIFAMLRIRGIWGQSLAPLFVLGLLTPVRSAITLYIQTQYTPVAFGVPLYGCGAVFNIANDLYTELEIACRAAALVIDVIVILLTWYKTWRIKRESYMLGISTPVITLLIRDGMLLRTVYFLIILVIQILGITSVGVGPAFVLWDVWPYFEQVFTVIFLTRFMLNLRGVYLSNTATDFTDTYSGTWTRHGSATLTGIQFSTSGVVGNMGAPLQFSSSKATWTLNGSSRAIGGEDGEKSEWKMEDGALEASSDPLYTGLGSEVGPVEGHELSEAAIWHAI